MRQSHAHGNFQLTTYIQKCSQRARKIKNLGKDTLKLLNDKGLCEEDFNRKTLFNHFHKLAQGTINGLYKNQLEKNLTEGQGLYIQSLSESKKKSLIP